MKRGWEHVPSTRSRSATFLAWLTPAIVLAGCHSHRMEPDSLPCGAIASPPGTYLNQWCDLMADLSQADRVVLYQTHWLDDSDQLLPPGKRVVLALARRGAAGAAVWVEPSADPDLDRRRVEAVRTEAALRGVELAPDAIQVGLPARQVLSGENSQRVTDGWMSGDKPTLRPRSGNGSTTARPTAGSPF